MRKTLCIVFLFFCLATCSDKNPVSGDYPVIDVIGSIGNYQKVYCSDLFSSIELIPLETTDECLLEVPNRDNSSGVIMNDNYILVQYTFGGDYRLCAFDHSGKFLNQIGRKGQGPGEFYLLRNMFFNTDKNSIYVENGRTNILEYNFEGKFINSIPIPVVEGNRLSGNFYSGNNLFIAHLDYNGKNEYTYCLYDSKGEIVKSFTNHIVFEREIRWNRYYSTLSPVRVDNRIYLKDYLNDTIFSIENSTLQTDFVFGLGKYTLSEKNLEIIDIRSLLKETLIIRQLIASPKYFFYEFFVPEILPTPKIKPYYLPAPDVWETREYTVYGIYNIEENTNILLDINEELVSERGIVNDINGGLPFFPRYYAGNNILVDMWDAAKMKETLTEEYFASKTIKDQQAHQKLKELLKNLKDDDNPVIVVAKLK